MPNVVRDAAVLWVYAGFEQGWMVAGLEAVPEACRRLVVIPKGGACRCCSIALLPLGGRPRLFDDRAAFVAVRASLRVGPDPDPEAVRVTFGGEQECAGFVRFTESTARFRMSFAGATGWALAR